MSFCLFAIWILDFEKTLSKDRGFRAIIIIIFFLCPRKKIIKTSAQVLASGWVSGSIFFVWHHHNVFSWCLQRAKKSVLCLGLSAHCVVLFVFRVSFKQQSVYGTLYIVMLAFFNTVLSSSLCQPRACKWIHEYNIHKYKQMKNTNTVLSVQRYSCVAQESSVEGKSAARK